MRAVSLVPSLTETLFALGAGESVVGITDFCIFPEGIDRPRVGGTKTPNIARIRQLAPDIVYVNVEENLKKHADEIAEFARVVATEPKTIDDVAQLLTQLGSIHACEAKAAELIKRLTVNREPLTPFTFVVPIWKKPWMWCGGDTYVSSLVESVGGRNLLRDRQRYPAIELVEVLALTSLHVARRADDRGAAFSAFVTLTLSEAKGKSLRMTASLPRPTHEWFLPRHRAVW